MNDKAGPVNGVRGERIITINGTEYKAIPTYRAAAVIETNTGTALLNVCASAMSGSISIITAILYGCIVAGLNAEGKPASITLDEIGEAVMGGEHVQFKLHAVALALEFTKKLNGASEDKKEESNEAPQNPPSAPEAKSKANSPAANG